MDTRPSPAEYGAYYETYLALAPEPDALLALEEQLDVFRAIVRAIPADRETWRYEAGKWSIRELFDHLIDAERVFGYRAFCIGRGDRTPLPSFDENAYAAAWWADSAAAPNTPTASHSTRRAAASRVPRRAIGECRSPTPAPSACCSPPPRVAERGRASSPARSQPTRGTP